MSGITLEQMRGDYDWEEAFRYASGGNMQTGQPDVRRAAPVGDDACPLDPFGIGDVDEILGADEGENDVADWICWGRLKDGRYFSLRAGCDYTGWDCQAGGHAEVASDLGLMRQFGLTEDERERLGVAASREGQE